MRRMRLWTGSLDREPLLVSAHAALGRARGRSLFALPKKEGRAAPRALILFSGITPQVPQSPVATAWTPRGANFLLGTSPIHKCANYCASRPFAWGSPPLEVLALAPDLLVIVVRYD